VGSGLILLVIVGAWLAVLVPMALRSHDSSTSLSSVDRFNDAMRVLSRREQAGRTAARTFVVPRRPEVEQRAAVPIEVRRRRVLLSLVGLAAAVALLGSLGLGSPLLAVLPAGLAVAYVVHLRRQAILKAERQRRQALAHRAARRAGRQRPSVRPPVPQVRIAGIPDRMPPRPVPLTAPLPAPAARYEDPQPVAAQSSTSTWSPTAFPVPTYVTAPVAPPRPPRVLDLTRPGEWSASLEAAEAELAGLHDDDELDDILDTRRASGDW
jgi:hypothetical protein